MFNALQSLPIPLLLLLATMLEVSGDAIVRLSIYKHAGPMRIGLAIAAAVLLLGYGSLLNIAPVAFERIVGLYIATLFVVWQVLSFVFFRTVPSLPILLGGALVLMGGIIITFWRPG